MLTPEERNFIYNHAYVPEHLPDYVQPISGAEPFLHGGCLCFVQQRHLIFVGYPLQNQEIDIARIYESACDGFRANTVAFIGSSIPAEIGRADDQSEDSYYRLDLPLKPLTQDVAYMIRRARRELRVSEGTFSDEHKAIVDAFLSERKLGTGHHEIFNKLPSYLDNSKTACLIEARRGDYLAAFNIVDFGSDYYMFYMFNFRSLIINAPGASDLLFYEMAHLAETRGKRAINLGLGISPGVRGFKEKWGAVPFLSYASALLRRRAGLLARILGSRKLK